MLLVLASILTAQAGSLNLDVEVASAYVWRGANVFALNGQSHQVPMVAPSATYTTGGLWLSYWGAYQLGGSHAGTLVDIGVGAEQDFTVGYDMALNEALDASFSITAYAYPLADSRLTGTDVPLWLEPAVTLALSGAAAYGLTVSWFQGMQGATKGFSFVYIQPTVGTSLPLFGETSLALDAELGLKGFIGGSDLFDGNSLHAAVHAGVPIALPASFYVKPAVHLGWTNADQGFGEGLVPWVGVNLGCDL